MLISKEHEYLFASTGAKRWLNRPRPQRANAILPLTHERDPRRLSDESFLYADDPRALRLTEWLSEQCNKEFPVDLRPSGFCGPSAVPADFNGLRNVSGVGMNPLPIPVSDNGEFVKSRGLVDRIRPGDEQWLRELVRLFFGAAAPNSLYIRKAASTSFPYFSTSEGYKKLSVLKALRESDEFLRCMTGNESDLRDGLNDYHAIAIFAIHERQQPNAIFVKDEKYHSKPRTAPTEEEARTGKYVGKTFADMTARDSAGNPIADHFAMRRRDVFGGNGVVNYFLTAIIGCFRKVYLDRFAFTYKVRGREDKAERVSRFKHVVGSDVKTMDKLVPRWFLDFVMDELTKYLDDRVVTLMKRSFQAPYVVPPPWADTPSSFNPVFGKSPLDPTAFVNHPGLPSGIAFNPDWGKLWMTFVYAILYRDVGALQFPAQLEAFLQGRNPDHGLLDMSDDATFLTNKAHVADALQKPTSPYAELEVERPVIYLGDVFTETASGGKDAFPNPVTFMVNLLCREDSIRKKDPVINAQGYLARLQVYSATPTFRDMLRLFEEGCRREIGVNPTLIARSLAVHKPMTDIDAMVRENPAVLHYKVDPSTVSAAVLDDVVSTIPSEDFLPYIRHLFKVPISEQEA